MGGSGGGGGGVRLFGVQLSIASPSSSPMKKSFSMDCMASCYALASSPSSSSSSSSPSLVCIDEVAEKISNGYLSDGLMGRAQERKKGVPWTEEEHRSFLAGLEKLGKGDWRGISRNFVTTRTPTQVASHAQKYFLRQNSLNKKQRRSSLFDVVGSCQERAAHATNNDNSSKSKEPTSFSYDSATNDLNSSLEQESNLAACLQLMPSLSPMPDLELGMSTSSRPLHQKKEASSPLFVGTISVT